MLRSEIPNSLNSGKPPVTHPAHSVACVCVCFSSLIHTCVTMHNICSISTVVSAFILKYSDAH